MADFDVEHVLALLQEGEYARAEHECRLVLANDPENESSLSLLGMALHQQGQTATAVAVYEQLTWLYPSDASHWNNYATTLRGVGHLADAERAYLAALRLSPDDSVTLGNLGLLHKERADYVSARACLLRAAQGLPGDWRIRIYAAMACYECGDTKTVDKLVADWRQWPALDDELRLDLAWLLAQMGRTNGAEYLLEQSMSSNAADSTRTLAMVRKVLLLERVNRLDEARAITAMLPDPVTITDQAEQNEVIGALSVIAQRGKDNDATRQLLEHLLELTPEPRHQANLYFALAKACDKAGDTTAVLVALDKGHKLQLEAAARLAPELLLPEVQPLAPSLIRITPAQASGWSTAAAPRLDLRPPIFVVGFPRSGTTMLEQMLDAHPMLVSMDEQPFLQEVSDRIVEHGRLYPEGLGELNADECDLLVRYYWEQVRSVASLQPGQRLVDKNPLNLLHLPLICRLFPDAPIILALRHPCDVILSCYMQNFRSPAFQILCSSLSRLARGYVNAMQYWIYHAQLFKPRVLNLRYEDLLDHFDDEVDRIGRFIEIDDISPLRNFHSHALQKGFISTPSYAQVTQKPNKAAVDRWRRYQEDFAPILPIVNDVLEHWGYDT